MPGPMSESHESLRGGLLKFFDAPGKATSVMAAYVHEGGKDRYEDCGSLQAQLYVASKGDAVKMLMQLEEWQSALVSIIEKGKL